MADATRIEATAQQFLSAVLDRGDIWICSDLRVGLKDAAWLVGKAPGTLRNLIGRGEGPEVYDFGGGGHKVTVRLYDLAAWVESRRK